MLTFRTDATDKAPAMMLDPASGLVEITGVSIPENADKVFAPLFGAIDEYAAAPSERTTVRIGLTYFNSSSAKYILDALKRLDDLHATGRSKVLMEWLHAPGDLDMMEAGRDYKSLVEFPVKLVENLY